MNKKTLVLLVIIILAILAIVIISIKQNRAQNPVMTKQELLGKYQTLESQYTDLKAEGYDVSQVETLAVKAKTAYDKGDYKTAGDLLNSISNILASIKIANNSASPASSSGNNPSSSTSSSPMTSTAQTPSGINCTGGLIDNRNGNYWIREGAIYRTHPVFYPGHSFKEITAQISSLKDLGVKTILLAPFWTSPKSIGPATMSYHPLSYYKLNPEYGTLDELNNLIKTIHSNNMKVMLSGYRRSRTWV